MTEISSIQLNEPYEFYETKSPSSWESIGRITFHSMSFIALCGFAAAMSKKKRTFTRISIPTTSGIPVQILENQEIAEPSFSRCTPDEKKKITELFKTIAEIAFYQLPWYGPRLYQLGSAIDHVHPFSLILASPRDSMRTIFLSQSEFKITQVLNGIEKGIQKIPNIEQHIPAFAKEIKKDPNQIKQLIQARDWKKFAHYLFDIDDEHVE